MSSITLPINCRHCGKVMKTAGPVIIGEKPEERTARQMQALGEHLQATHPEALMKAVMIGAQVQGMLLMQNFETSDPTITTHMDQMRYEIHHNTRRIRIPDASIALRVSKIELSPDQAEEVAQAMREMRDILMETDRQPEPANPTRQ